MENVSSSNSHKVLVPKLRFPEFSGEWLPCMLGEIAISIEYGMNAPAIKFDGKNKYIRITDIDDSTNQYINDNPVSPNGVLEERYLVKQNDILFARTGASVGKTYIYDIKDGILYYAGFLIRLRVKPDTNSKYIFTNTLTPRYRKWVNLTSMRSGQPGINSQEFSTYRIAVPTLLEQNKLANFITLIDERLDKQRELIKHLKSYKRGVLQSINVPTKTYCVGQIFNITRGYVLPTSNVAERKSSSNCYPVYSSQTKNDGLMGYFNQYLYENAITWTTDGANAGYTRYRDGKFYCTNVCGVLLNDDGYANEFVAAKINEISKKYVSYVGNPKLMNNVMAEIKVDLPDIEKQQYYSKLIDLLNRMIDYNSKILENLADIKLSFLQQLFI